MLSKTSLLRAGLLSLGMTFQAQAETIDSERNYRVIDSALANACISNRSRDVENCTTEMMNATLGLAQAFEAYLDRTRPGHGDSRALFVNCANNFDAITTQYQIDQLQDGPESALHEYFRNAFLGSKKCIETVEEISTRYGINYMPSVRGLLRSKINDAENGRIVSGFSL